MKPRFTLLALLCAAQVLSCSAGRETAVARLLPPIILASRDGRMELSLRSRPRPSQKDWTGTLGLRAAGEDLLGVSPDGTTNELWLDGLSVPLTRGEGFRVLERQAGNDWTYVSADMTPQAPGRVKQFIRHLLVVEPDLFVICDEIVLTEPALVEAGRCFPAGTIRDAAREEWRLQRPQAGLTARILGAPRNNQRLSTAAPAAKPDDVCARSGTTNRVVEFRQITVLVPHAGEARRSLAFKLLESETAIGVRVHRDGLPTLVAFRKNGVAGEANLTGLKFTSPVAVDVFRPKK